MGWRGSTTIILISPSEPSGGGYLIQCVVMDDISSPLFWDQIYTSGRTGWELGQPTPVFRSLLGEGIFSPGKMLVLCAGRGDDARMFARKGFDVTAVDFAEEAVRDMNTRMEKHAPIAVLKADLFQLPSYLDASFDYVLEYTCYCALDPKRRAEYVEKVDRLLKVEGIYIALAFPVGEHSGGPPFSVSSCELVDPFLELGYKLVRHEVPQDSIPERKGREVLIVLQKG